MHKLKKFINFDKSMNMFYDNIWLDEQKIVIKMPLTKKDDPDNFLSWDIRIEEFSLVNNIYLLAYD
jgi:hypothetical protein